MFGNVTVWAHEHPNLIALFVAAAGLGATILVLRTRGGGDSTTDPTTDVGTGLINSGGGSDSNQSVIEAINKLLDKLNTTVTNPPTPPTPNPLPKPTGYLGPPIKGVPTSAPSNIHGSVAASVKMHPNAQLIKPVQLGRYIDPNKTTRNVS
jgi:hypothetical protein